MVRFTALFILKKSSSAQNVISVPICLMKIKKLIKSKRLLNNTLFKEKNVVNNFHLKTTRPNWKNSIKVFFLFFKARKKILIINFPEILKKSYDHLINVRFHNFNTLKKNSLKFILQHDLVVLLVEQDDNHPNLKPKDPHFALHYNREEKKTATPMEKRGLIKEIINTGRPFIIAYYPKDLLQGSYQLKFPKNQFDQAGLELSFLLSVLKFK